MVGTANKTLSAHGLQAAALQLADRKRSTSDISSTTFTLAIHNTFKRLNVVLVDVKDGVIASGILGYEVLNSFFSGIRT